MADAITVDTRRFKQAAERVKRAIPRDVFRAVNLAIQVIAELLKQATPRLTGKTRRAARAAPTERFDRKAVAGFFPRKGNTAFVARILEQGRRPAPAVLRESRRGMRIVKKRAASFMAPRPIVSRVMPLVPNVIREAFRRVFGDPWPRDLPPV
jgi:hypothetical protein